jgi:valyl-tRNA synthetase
MPAMGADALRFTLLTGSTPGNDSNLSLQRVEGNRNFTNKIWNAVRFVLAQLAEDEPYAGWQIDATINQAPAGGLAERWILSRLSDTVREATRLMEGYQYGEAGRQVYEFFWNEFCDWYLEMSKITLYGQDDAAKAATRTALVKVLDDSLRLLHPFIPFVTEETWGYLKQAANSGRDPEEAGWPAALIVAPWPEPGAVDADAEAGMDLVMGIVRSIRNARAEYNVQPGHRIPATIVGGGQTELLRSQADVMSALARLEPEQLSIQTQAGAPPRSLTLVAGAATVYLPLAGLIDLDAERARLDKELADLQAQAERSAGLLAGPFAQKAKPEVVQRERDKLSDLQERAARLKQRLTDLA